MHVIVSYILYSTIIDFMFEAEQFPACISYANPSMTDIYEHEFTHAKSIILRHTVNRIKLVKLDFIRLNLFKC
jgi:hypothetical protein